MTEPTIDNLAMLIIRLVRRVRKFDPADTVAAHAMGYLERCDLIPSPLRAETTINAKPET